MKSISKNGRRSKYGGVILAASLGLLLLLGGCVSCYGQADAVTGTDGASDERSSFSRMLDTIFAAVNGWTEESGASNTESSPPETGSKELPNTTSFVDPADDAGSKGGHLSLIELEAKKAKALQDQRMGIPCVDCVDDGEGNLLPAALLESINVQKTKARVDQSQVKKKKNDVHLPKLASDSSFHDQRRHDKKSSDGEPSSDSAEDVSKLPVTSSRRQLSKSKNKGGIIAPFPPFPTNCRCEYPSERIYTFPTQDVNQFVRVGGQLIVPGDSIYCRDVFFICDLDDRPPNSVEWTCPNFNPPVIINPKGKGKGNKNRNIILGNGGLGGFGGVVVGGGGRRLSGQSLSDDGERRKLSGSESRKLHAGSSRRSLSKNKCGKGKGNKGINNCILPPILPPVPTRPQYVLLPPDDPDCRRPTPDPTPRPPPPTPDARPPPCEEPYEEWIDCVADSRGCTGCQTIPNTPGGWLFPQEECDVFEDWFPANFECCDPCVDELAAFEDCKDCGGPGPTPPPPPTPRPTPRLPPPSPGVPPPCEETYDDWIECVSVNDCSGCERIPSTPGGWLIPGEECDVFEEWFPINFECCDACVGELLDFEDCKECGIASPTPPAPTPGGGSPSARPTPRPTPSPTIGVPATGEVEGLVFLDENGNGVRDPGEPGIPGVDVVITDSSRTSTTVTTRRNGRYTAVVPVGETEIDIDEDTLPDGVEQTAGENPSTVIVREGRTATEVDGYQLPGPDTGEVSGVVFEDTNGNGIQDPGEPGIDDVDVVITDSSGTTQTVNTRRTGRYSAVVPAGPVQIDIDEDTLPGGATQTVGDNPTEVEVPEGGIATDIDGYQISGKVKGTIFEDTNGNGRQDPGEPGIEDVDVVITDSTGALQTVTTDETGMYMAEVPVGSTEIDIDEDSLPDGSEQTTGSNPTTVTVRPGRTTTDEDGFQVVGELEGVVFQDTNGNGRQDPGEPGIEDVDVVITDSSGEVQTLTTDEDGEYSAKVPRGSTEIDIDEDTLPSGVIQTAGENPTTVEVPGGGTATDGDGYQPQTDAPTPRPTPPPPTPAPKGKIKGVVFEDTNGNGERDPGEPGIDDVDVVITDSSGATQTVTTSRTGRYSADVPAGPAEIEIDEDTLPEGAKQTSGENPTDVVVPSGGTATDEDGYQVIGKVKGLVFEDTNGNGRKDRREPGIEDVDVVITDSAGDSQTVTTDETGMYMAEVPRGRTEIDIDENTIPEGFEQTAGDNPSAGNVPGGGTVTDEDGFQPPQTDAPTPRPTPSPTKAPTGKVEGVVFEDTNGNGERDPGESGIEGVDVVITDSSGDSQTVTTDEDGTYEATVPPGTTEIDIDEETLPEGSEQTAGDNPTTVEVPEDGTATDEDGFQVLGEIEGVVFLDTNGNGRQDPGEPGIEDVDVVITDSSGESQTLTTDEDGEYSAEVPRGPTEIDIDEDTLPSGVVQTAGENPTTVEVPGGGTATDEDGYQPQTDAPTPRPTPRPTKRPTPSPTEATTGKVEGVVFEDTNGNGERDPGEPGIEDVDVVITDSSGDSQTVTTDENGTYEATVPPGTTEIDIDEETLPEESEQTAGDNPSTVEVPEDGTATDEDGFQVVGKVEGIVFLDINGNGRQDLGEPGIEDVDVVITDSSGESQTLTTDEDGEYSAEVPRGPTEIDIDEDTLPSGVVQTAGENPTTVEVPGGGTATDEDGYQSQTDAPTPRPNPRPTERPPPPPTPRPTKRPTLPPPTRKPTKMPTATPPTKRPTLPPPTPGGCVYAEITFDSLPNGLMLQPGEYISDQYEPFYGLTFSSTGDWALGDHPRLFDSANPGKKVGDGFCGDKDLGAPNRECPGGGPGIGEGGEPGPNGDNPYQNCDPLGNILIIQEDNRKNRCGYMPDDNQEGGVITLDFSPAAAEVYSFDMLDVDYPVSITVVYIDDDGNMKEKPPIDAILAGDNSLQTVVVDCKNVVQLRLYLKRSGAMTSLRFCYNDSRRELSNLRAMSVRK